MRHDVLDARRAVPLYPRQWPHLNERCRLGGKHVPVVVHPVVLRACCLGGGVVWPVALFISLSSPLALAIVGLRGAVRCGNSCKGHCDAQAFVARELVEPSLPPSHGGSRSAVDSHVRQHKAVFTVRTQKRGQPCGKTACVVVVVVVAVVVLVVVGVVVVVVIVVNCSCCGCSSCGTIPPKMITCEIRKLIQKHFVSKKIQKIVTGVIIKNNTSAKKVVTDFHFLSELTLAGSWSVVAGAHIQASTFSQRLLSQDHGRLPVVHVSKHSHPNLHTCWSALQKKKGLWARPPVLTPVPSQAIHSRACLNSNHSDIQGTAQKSPCVNTFFEAIAK